MDSYKTSGTMTCQQIAMTLNLYQKDPYKFYTSIQSGVSWVWVNLDINTSHVDIQKLCSDIKSVPHQKFSTVRIT